MEHKYVFFVEKNRIEVYSFENDEFVKMKFKGEDIYIGEKKDFWKEWESKAGYIDEIISKVDFCIIGEDEVFTGINKYIAVKKTVWNKTRIQKFLKEIRNLDIKVIDTGIYHIKINGELKKIHIYPGEICKEIKMEKEIRIEENFKKEKIIIKEIEEEKIVKKKESMSIADFYKRKSEERSK
ncbi:MAG: hypothetical protein ACRC30_15720 [Clostridium sp.]